jgi:Transposase DDE domain
MSGQVTLPLLDVAGQVERVLIELVRDGAAPLVARRGRPPILPAAVLWASLVIGVLRGGMSQAAVWRLTMDQGLWGEPRIRISDEAVYRRLAAVDASPLGELWPTLSTLLADRIDPWVATDLVPFAVDVVALDETTLDPVARSLPALRTVPPGDQALLPGKIAGVFDLRRQQWRTITLITDPHQNERVAARDLVAGLTPGTLILADLGYFGFEWFDDLTDRGYLWVSRLRAKTSYRVAHVHYDDGTTFDGLVWLGAHRADRAKHLVRLVRFRTGQTERAYLTNVRSPLFLRPAQIAALYARRWDIEMAVNLVKRHLGLHLLWSAKSAVIHHQIWAVLLIAQIVQALRVEIAGRAKIDLFDVSIELLITHLPRYATISDDPIAAFIADGPSHHYFRPARRVTATAPPLPMEQVIFPPPDLVATQEPRYARRKCGPRRALTQK